MVQMKTGMAYALFRSVSPAGDIKRELNERKEALGTRAGILEIQVLQLCVPRKSGDDTRIPSSITSAAALKNANYIVRAEEKWKTNERTAHELDELFRQSTEAFRPDNVSIYYNRNGGSHFECMIRG